MSDDCSKHKKSVAGISDMKVLAEMIGDLHYESLNCLLADLAFKLDKDSYRDKGGREDKIIQQIKKMPH